jgi:hypothetical protein
VGSPCLNGRADHSAVPPSAQSADASDGRLDPCVGHAATRSAVPLVSVIRCRAGRHRGRRIGSLMPSIARPERASVFQHFIQQILWHSLVQVSTRWTLHLAKPVISGSFQHCLDCSGSTHNPSVVGSIPTRPTGRNENER